MSESVEASGDLERKRPRMRKRILRVAIMLVIGFLVYRATVEMVGTVEWSDVWAAFGRLGLLYVVLQIIALLVRQALNASPMWVFVPGLNLMRAMMCDLAGNLAARVVPPPSDAVLRVKMFQSWGIDGVTGMTGVMLDKITSSAVRFMSGALGLVFVAITGIRGQYSFLAALSLLVGVIMIALLLAIVRGDRPAALIGRVSGRIVKRVRRRTDPEAWAASLVRIRTESAGALGKGLIPALVARGVMTLVDGVILLMALRFLDVESGALPATKVMTVFLIAYPLTILPLQGTGILDSVLLGGLVVISGVAYEPDVVAAILIWRVTLVVGPLLLGTISLGLWRYTSTRAVLRR